MIYNSVADICATNEDVRRRIVEHVAKVDYIEDIDGQIAEVVVHGLDQLLGRRRCEHRPIVPAPRADFGDDDKACGVGVERLLDDLMVTCGP